MPTHDFKATRKQRSYYREIRQNKKRLRLALIAYFLLALFAGQATGRALLFVADPEEYYAHRYEGGLDGSTEPDTSLFSYVNQVTLAVLLLAWVNYHRMHRRGDTIILSLAGARALKDQKFINTGEEMAIAAGITPPRMWVIEDPGLNAFACCRADGRASIALTRGMLDRFSRSQVQAVVAHEVAHISSGDAQLMTVMLGIGRTFHLISAIALGPLRAFFDAGILADDAGPPDHGETIAQVKQRQSASIMDRPATLRGVLLAALAMPFVALILLVVGLVLSLTLYFAYSILILLFPWLIATLALWEILRDVIPAFDRWVRKRLSGHCNWFGVLLLIIPVGLMVGPAILVLGLLVPALLLLLRLAVSRNREFQADATAVKLTGNPGALRTALEQMLIAWVEDSGGSRLPRVLSPLTIVGSHRSWIAELGLDWLATLFSTHPPLEERITRLSEMEGHQ